MEAEIMNAIISALGAIFIALITYLSQKIVMFLNEKGIKEKLESKQYLVDIAVRAVEQVYTNEGGPEKFAKAKEEALLLLNKNGLEIGEKELDDFIEASVQAMNQGAQQALEPNVLPKHKSDLN